MIYVGYSEKSTSNFSKNNEHLLEIIRHNDNDMELPNK